MLAQYFEKFPLQLHDDILNLGPGGAPQLHPCLGAEESAPLLVSIVLQPRRYLLLLSCVERSFWQKTAPGCSRLAVSVFPTQGDTRKLVFRIRG